MVSLNITELNQTDKRIMEIAFFAMLNDNEDMYLNLSEIFKKRFEMSKVLKELNQSLSS
jgi:hypothetical protein